MRFWGKRLKNGVLRCWDDSWYRGFGVLGYRGIGVSGFWGFGPILGIGVSGYRGIGACTFFVLVDFELANSGHAIGLDH